MSDPVLVHGAPSVHIGTDAVDAWVTLDGAHLAPVTFHGDGREGSPYALAPWLPDERANDPHLLDTMRGDFLCLPFGAQDGGPLHGDPANGMWSVLSQDAGRVTLAIDTQDTHAHIEKTVSLRPGDLAVYQEFRITGLDGDFNYGTHPIIDFSGMAPGAARVSTSPMR